ncbi:unnamed protein product [Linum trigynum]|uniref:Uncharacterized protein n=1 Tax=Linum trigynum TaxID=586398 RepID=A0AAV2G0L1_9ROSI
MERAAAASRDSTGAMEALGGQIAISIEEMGKTVTENLCQALAKTMREVMIGVLKNQAPTQADPKLTGGAAICAGDGGRKSREDWAASVFSGPGLLPVPSAQEISEARGKKKMVEFDGLGPEDDELSFAEQEGWWVDPGPVGAGQGWVADLRSGDSMVGRANAD